MAEANAIGRLTGDAAPVRLSYSDKGFQFNLTIRIPSVRETVRTCKLKAQGLYNYLCNAAFPLPPLLVQALIVLGIYLVLNSQPDSWVRNGWLANFVWSVSLWFPWIEGIPLAARLCILAAYTSLGVAVVFATLQRVLIRLMLQYKGFVTQSRRPSLGLKLWLLGMKILVGGRRHLLYSFQGVLPSLPVPPLSQTLTAYLNSVQPLQTPEQFEQTKVLARDFESGVGPRLQRYLTLKSFYAPNYVTDWWEKYVYLTGRSPIVIGSNYYMSDAVEYTPTHMQEARTAVLLYNYMTYREQLESEQLQPTMLAAGVVPLCMEQIRRLFSTTRIPGRECDTIVHLSCVEAPLHVAVLCNGSLYTLPLFRRSGARVSACELEQQLREIKLHATANTPDEVEKLIPALTAENRTRWAEIRDTHFSEGVNGRALHAIESALLFVHMDVETTDVDTVTGRARSLMHGNGATRWFDKSLNLVTFTNGHCGMNAEHSFADAPVVAHLFEVAMIVADKHAALYYDKDGHAKAQAVGTAACTSAREPLTPWTPITWSISRPCETLIRTAYFNVLAQIADLDLQVVSYAKYGKGLMKKCNVSPDAFIQMAMQYAYFKDTGTFRATYEASMTRLYKHGRTETVRPVSMHSVAFVRAMCDPHATGEERLAALQLASATHQDLYQCAMTGKGVDRHLFALFIMSKGLHVESPFLQGALGEPWYLSTSQQPQVQTNQWSPVKDAHLVSPGGGFGPVTDNGYGVSYMVAKEDETFFHVSSKRSSPKTSSAKFIEHLFAAFDEMGNILDQIKAKKSQ